MDTIEKNGWTYVKLTDHLVNAITDVLDQHGERVMEYVLDERESDYLIEATDVIDKALLGGAFEKSIVSALKDRVAMRETEIDSYNDAKGIR